jgi:hypothetical protein
MPKFTLTLEVDPDELGKHEDPQRAMEDPEFLRSLCRKEVERFERYCTSTDPNFSDGAGFARIEARAIEGYLYQAVKGHIDAFDSGDLLPLERKDGTAASS